MKNTIVRINYTHYHENVIINNEEREAELLKLAKTDKSFLSFDVWVKGDYVLKNPYIGWVQTEQEDSFLINAKNILNCTEALMLGGMDWEETKKGRFQKVRTNGIGDFITKRGQKIYLVIDDYEKFEKFYIGHRK
jgi:hypothetical protein